MTIILPAAIAQDIDVEGGGRIDETLTYSQFVQIFGKPDKYTKPMMKFLDFARIILLGRIGCISVKMAD